LLTGRVPFRGGSTEHYMLLHTQQTPPSLRALRPELPRDLETICNKCLEKEPGRRYADCQALADDLRRWLEDELVTARRPGPVERLERWVRRSPAAAGLTMAVAALLLVGASVATVLAIHAGNKAEDARNEAKRANKLAQDNEKAAKEQACLADKARQLAKKEHVPMVPAPTALPLTLCDQVIVEEGTKKVSLIGSFRKLYARSFPFVPLPFCVFATLTGSQAEGAITLTVREAESDEEVYSVTHRVAFPDRFAEGRVVFRLADCAFPKPGAYLFTLAVDDDWVAHRRLQIHQMEAES